MEPSDFDKAIQDKLQQKSGLHQNEMAEAKLALWSQVDANLHAGRPTPWYWLVAAAIILLIGFSSVLYRIQEVHRQELDSFRAELAQMRQRYQFQSQTVANRDQQVISLEDELAQMEQQLAALPVQQPIPAIELIIYQTDTVYLTEIRYLTEAAVPSEPQTTNNELSQVIIEEVDSVAVVPPVRPTFIAIASRPKDQKNDQSIQVKFGSFTKKLRNP